MDNLYYTVCFFIFGACFGSFANVIIYRLPRGESVILPRSQCMSCKKTISGFDNIPILSWFILRGKCRNCSAPFSIRYVLVELLMALLFAGLFFKFNFTWLFLEYLFLIFGLVTVTMIDFDHMILPDVFTLSGIVFGLVGGALNPERIFWPDSVLGFIFGGGFLWAVAAIYTALRKQEGMGGGDIKLLAWIGAILGWTSVPFMIITSSLIGSLVGVALMIRTKGGLTYAIPFGPYISLAAIIYIFCGHELSNAYFHFFLPSLVP